MNTKLTAMRAVCLCALFLWDYPIISAIYSNEKNLFRKYYLCLTKRDINQLDKAEESRIEELWTLLRTTVIPLLETLRNEWPQAAEWNILYRGTYFREI